MDAGSTNSINKLRQLLTLLMCPCYALGIFTVQHLDSPLLLISDTSNLDSILAESLLGLLLLALGLLLAALDLAGLLLGALVLLGLLLEPFILDRPGLRPRLLERERKWFCSCNNEMNFSTRQPVRELALKMGQPRQED